MGKPFVSGDNQEIIIKSKQRVQKHGEVFTPKWMVEKMLNVPGVNEACNSVTATFLEPAVGEGTFLIEVLKRKLSAVSKEHCSSLVEYENYSLLALSSLYGIELLEDNAHLCIMNIFDVFSDYYIEVSKKLDAPINNEMLASAKVIISSNIRQGNFLTRLAPNGEPIRFSKWRVANDISKKAKVIKESQSKQLEAMKFDVIIGNPPYQEETPGENRQAKPIYHLFMEEAYEISDKVVFITPARFLFNTGATPKKWNRKMLKDKHFKVEFFEKDSSKVFPNTDIKGGVVITARNKGREFEPIEVFTSDDRLKIILQKVNRHLDKNIGDLVYSPDSYRFSDILFDENPILVDRTDDAHAKAVASNVFQRYPEVFYDEKPDDGQDYIRIYGRMSGKRMFKWIKRSYLNNHPNIDKWKVFVPGASGSGVFGEMLSSPIVGEPQVGHNQTFISIGAFETEFEAEAVLKYIKTKFGRALLGVMKVTQNNQPKETWSKIPLLDFSSLNEIDWDKSISEIDQQLYARFELSVEEVEYIEENVRPMI